MVSSMSGELERESLYEDSSPMHYWIAVVD